MQAIGGHVARITRKIHSYMPQRGVVDSNPVQSIIENLEAICKNLPKRPCKDRKPAHRWQARRIDAFDAEPRLQLVDQIHVILSPTAQATTILGIIHPDGNYRQIIWPALMIPQQAQ